MELYDIEKKIILSFSYTAGTCGFGLSVRIVDYKRNIESPNLYF